MTMERHPQSLAELLNQLDRDIAKDDESSYWAEYRAEAERLSRHLGGELGVTEPPSTKSGFSATEGPLDTSVEETAPPLWFECPGCSKYVTCLVLGTGPRNTQLVSRTHCCLRCQASRGHDEIWCCGTPRDTLFEIPLPGPKGCEVHGNCVIHVPDWERVHGPVPALLFLHGALTYLWPECLHNEVQNLVSHNHVVRDFIIIAPMAAIGQPFAVVSTWRTHHDRFENVIPYVENFDIELIWQCFLAACESLGPEKVDFGRLFATGFSMGAEAVWNLAISRGSLLAAAVPMAGCCKWPSRSWALEDDFFAQVKDLPLRAFSAKTDDGSYNIKDFMWMAEKAGLPEAPTEETWNTGFLSPERVDIKLNVHSWGGLAAHLELFLNYDDHNCWDLVYHHEHVFGLFTWMASCHNPAASAYLLEHCFGTSYARSIDSGVQIEE